MSPESIVIFTGYTLGILSAMFFEVVLVFLSIRKIESIRNELKRIEEMIQYHERQTQRIRPHTHFHAVPLPQGPYTPPEEI